MVAGKGAGTFQPFGRYPGYYGVKCQTSTGVVVAEVRVMDGVLNDEFRVLCERALSIAEPHGSDGSGG